jgi:hypothetical protein
MARFKKLLGFGTIGGLDDVLVRAAKVAVSTWIGLMGADALGWARADATSARTALITASAAGANVIINTVVKWASS